MGGGGSYYDRDVTSGGSRTSTGYSDFASQVTGRGSLDRSLLPLNRTLVSGCKSPLVCPLDGTGSMGTLPRILCDKWPMIAGQIAMQKYLDDVMVSLAIVGDVESDRGPIQTCDFAKIRDLDPWLQKLWIEGRGGGQHFESYEFMAYYYARCYDMRNAENPMLIFTGDEGFREYLSSQKLREHFGGEHQDVTASEIFDELKKKFKGNLFLIHRYYSGYDLDKEIVTQWTRVLGKENVVKLETETAVGDIMLGIIALASRSRTLDQYIKDMEERPLEMGGVKYEPQSKARLDEVRQSLKLLASTIKPAPKRKTVVKKTASKATTKVDDKAGPAPDKNASKKPKPGRIF